MTVNYDSSQGTLGFEDGAESLKIQAQRALEEAQNLARRNDPATEDAFKNAESLAIKAACPDSQMRAYYRHGEFLAMRGAFTRAHEHFLIAARNAPLSDKNSEEWVARIELHIIESQIEAATEKEIKTFFNNFKSVAKTASKSWDERHDVWLEFSDDRDRSNERLAARKFGSEEDFRRRFEMGRQRKK